MATPWFPFYASDFYASTAAWSPDWVGAYIRLLSFAWMNGGIPNDREAINRISGGLSDAGWNAISARMILVDNEREQRWVHPRMERERDRTNTIRKARQDAAATTNKKRHSNECDGDRSGDRSGDRDGERHAHRVVTTTTVTSNPPTLTGGGRGEGMNSNLQNAAGNRTSNAVSRAADSPAPRSMPAKVSEGQRRSPNAPEGECGDLPYRDVTPLELARIQRWPGCKAIDNDSVDRQRTVFVRTLREKQIGSAMIRAAWEAAIVKWGENGKPPYEFAKEELVSDWKDIKQPDSIIRYRLGGAA